MKIFISIFLLYIMTANYGFSSDHLKKYNCNIKTSTNIKNLSPLEMSAPAKIDIIYDPLSKSVINFFWNQQSVINDFELISENSSLELIEIRRKGYGKTFSDDDIRNSLYFTLNLNNLSASLKKQFIRPVNYNCS